GYTSVFFASISANRSSCEPDQDPSRRIRYPDPLVQRGCGYAESAHAAARAGRQARAAGRADGDLSGDADPAGSIGRALDPHSGAGARGVPPVAADTALSRAPPRGGARDAGEDLLQVRRREPGG